VQGTGVHNVIFMCALVSFGMGGCRQVSNIHRGRGGGLGRNIFGGVGVPGVL
jgi:hypothetical protein